VLSQSVDENRILVANAYRGHRHANTLVLVIFVLVIFNILDRKILNIINNKNFKNKNFRHKNIKICYCYIIIPTDSNHFSLSKMHSIILHAEKRSFGRGDDSTALVFRQTEGFFSIVEFHFRFRKSFLPSIIS